MSTRGEGGGGGITKKISAMSCILFQQHNDKYGHPNHHDQCSNCDLYLAESPFWSGKMKKKYETSPLPRRHLCLRLQPSNKKWVPFSDSDVFENITDRESANRESVSRDSANQDAGGGNGGLEERVDNSARRRVRERMRVRREDEILQRAVIESAEKVTGLKRRVDELSTEVVSANDGAETVKGEVLVLQAKVGVVTNLLGPLEEENCNLKKIVNNGYQREWRMKHSAPGFEDGDRFVSMESKISFISEQVQAVMTKVFPRTGSKKKAKFLAKMISDGQIFGNDGQEGYKELSLGLARKKFEPWRVLQALDQDSRCGNFSTVEIMRDVEGLEKYERGVFHGKSAMSRVAFMLEDEANKYVPYSCYVSETGHRNIAFDYEAVVRNCLLSMGLLEKAEGGSVSICFTLDFAEVCSTTKRGHVLAGIKIIDKDATHPRTKEKLFDYEPTTDSRNGGGSMQMSY